MKTLISPYNIQTTDMPWGIRKLSFITILLCLTTLISAQVHIDVKAGFSPGSDNPSTAKFINRDNPWEEFRFCLIHVDPQFYGGIKANVELNSPFFLEGGLAYTKRTSMYQANFTMPKPTELVPEEMQMSISEHLILLPIDIGASLGAFDITSGLRLNKIISTDNELTQLKGYGNNRNSLSWGWQSGVRYAFHRMMAGVEYQAEMKRDCEGMNVNDESLELRYVPGRFVFSLQYRF